jgi:dTDP-glucose 4,6-dehydratase
MRILITGGYGFIGSNYIRNILRNSENRVTNIDKMGTGSNPSNLNDLSPNSSYKFIKGNIRDTKLLTPIIKVADIVVNFAAETHVDRSINDPEYFIENNILGTTSILETIRKHNEDAKLIQVSTDEVYGSRETGSATEDTKISTSNPYSASKASADLLCEAYHRTYGLKTIITRSTNNFGPYQYQEKLIPKTIINALEDRNIPVYGSGNQVRDWIYVKDNCRAIEIIMEKGVPGEIYNISSFNEIENISIVEKILELVGKPKSLIEYTKDRPGHDFRYSLDSNKIRKLGWTPETSFENALKKTVNWYIENQEQWKISK